MSLIFIKILESFHFSMKTAITIGNCQNTIFTVMKTLKSIHSFGLLVPVWFGMLTACGQPSIESTLDRLNRESVPYISVDELNSSSDQVLLDARTLAEYEVSHLKDAFWAGHKKFDIRKIKAAYPDKNTPLVVYCSVGVRSENVGEELIETGYTDVKNLYGGIFEWKNKDYPVYTPEGHPTEKVHAFSRRWGKLLHNAEKIY